MTSTQSAAPTSAPAPKKSKGKKNADPPDARQQIAARLAQLEQDAAGERDQDIEIGAFVATFHLVAQLHVLHLYMGSEVTVNRGCDALCHY